MRKENSWRLIICTAVVLVIANSHSFATNTTVAFPEPLAAEKPLGSLVYDRSTSGAIQSTGDTVSYTLPVDAGQTITVDLSTDANLQGSISVTDPGNNVIASATAAGAGQELIAQTVPATTTGTYTIAISALNSSTGNFTVKVILNAALDLGAHGGSENSTIATAQDLSGGFISLTGASDRAGLLGHFDGTTDFYSFSLQSGQSSSLVLKLASNASVALELYDGSGNVLATGIAGGQNVSSIIQHFVAPAAGTYYAGLTGTGQSDYALVVTRSADFELEPNDQTMPQNLSQPLAVLGYIGNSVSMRDTDWYSFSVNAGDNLTLTTATPSDEGGEFHNNLFPQLDLYDSNFTRIATNAKETKNTPVTSTALRTGIYFARVSASSGSGSKHSVGEYVLTIQGATGP